MTALIYSERGIVVRPVTHVVHKGYPRRGIFTQRQSYGAFQVHLIMAPVPASQVPVQARINIRFAAEIVYRATGGITAQQRILRTAHHFYPFQVKSAECKCSGRVQGNVIKIDTYCADNIDMKIRGPDSPDKEVLLGSPLCLKARIRHEIHYVFRVLHSQFIQVVTGKRYHGDWHFLQGFLAFLRGYDNLF